RGPRAVDLHGCRRRHDRGAGADPSGRDPLCAAARGRAGAVDPARRAHRVASVQRNADAARHPPPAGGDPAAGRARCARVAGGRRAGSGVGGRGRRGALPASWRRARGVARSLRTYYGNRRHGPALDRLYAQFVRPDDLVFDAGAHVGDRVAAFRRLKARVVAIEPQPALVRTLRLLYGRDDGVTIEPVALGAAAGTVELRLNIDNPTV